jgi:uncharacterized protein (DUF58 family)
VLIPAPRLLWLAAVLLAASVGASVLGSELLWPALAAGLALLAAFDAWQVVRMPVPAVLRRVPGSLALGVRSEVALRVANRAARRVQCEVQDRYPPTLEAEGLPRAIALEQGGWTELRYRIRPVARGEAGFGPSELRLRSPLALWQLTRTAGEGSTVRVYPDFRAAAKYTLLATDHRLSQIGVLQVRRRGEGTEFHQLREYRPGDPQRAIDWKASARATRLISREYEEERDQQVLLLIDCGRRMASKDDALSHFDHVLNAALLLAHVALHQGDTVGLLTMGGARRHVRPRKSVAAVRGLLESLYDVEPTLAVPDYEEAAREVMRRQRRRALVILLTNLRDEDHDGLLPALRLLGSRHLVILASLREAITGRALAARVDGFDRAVTHAAAAQYLALRERMFRRVGAAGVIALDVEPAELAISLVNRYLELKREGRL